MEKQIKIERLKVLKPELEYLVLKHLMILNNDRFINYNKRLSILRILITISLNSKNITRVNKLLNLYGKLKELDSFEEPYFLDSNYLDSLSDCKVYILSIIKEFKDTLFEDFKLNSESPRLITSVQKSISPYLIDLIIR